MRNPIFIYHRVCNIHIHYKQAALFSLKYTYLGERQEITFSFLFFKFREQDHNSPGAKLFSFSSCNNNYILYERRCKKEGKVETNEYNSYKTFKKESCVGSVNINKCRQTLVQMLFVKR